jgi:hypothetical protein
MGMWHCGWGLAQALAQTVSISADTDQDWAAIQNTGALTQGSRQVALEPLHRPGC